MNTSYHLQLMIVLIFVPEHPQHWEIIKRC